MGPKHLLGEGSRTGGYNLDDLYCPDHFYTVFPICTNISCHNEAVIFFCMLFVICMSVSLLICVLLTCSLQYTGGALIIQHVDARFALSSANSSTFFVVSFGVLLRRSVINL